MEGLVGSVSKALVIAEDPGAMLNTHIVANKCL